MQNTYRRRVGILLLFFADRGRTRRERAGPNISGYIFDTEKIVRMDGKDLMTRDLIMGIEFENIPCDRASAEYDKRGVITFERAVSSIYSKRMVEAFGSKGMVRLSPLHVNTPEEICRFLQITQEIAAL